MLAHCILPIHECIAPAAGECAFTAHAVAFTAARGDKMAMWHLPVTLDTCFAFITFLVSCFVTETKASNVKQIVASSLTFLILLSRWM